MTWDSFEEPPGRQGPYIEYGPSQPVQAPVPPYGTPSGGWWTGAGSSTPSAPLPLGEAIKQLPKQYKSVLTRPGAATFAEEMGKAKWDIIWAQLLGYSIFSAILAFLALLILSFILRAFFGPLFQSFGSDTSFPGSLLGLPIALLGVLIAGFTFIASIAGFFISQGITYLLAKVFGGQGSFIAQAYTALLYQVPIGVITVVLTLIPFVGSIAGSAAGIYQYVLQAYSLMAVHRLSGGKAVAVVAIPVAVAILLGVAAYIITFFMFFNNFHSFPAQ